MGSGCTCCTATNLLVGENEACIGVKGFSYSLTEWISNTTKNKGYRGECLADHEASEAVGGEKKDQTRDRTRTSALFVIPTLFRIWILCPLIDKCRRKHE